MKVVCYARVGSREQLEDHREEATNNGEGSESSHGNPTDDKQVHGATEHRGSEKKDGGLCSRVD